MEYLLSMGWELDAPMLVFFFLGKTIREWALPAVLAFSQMVFTTTPPPTPKASVVLWPSTGVGSAAHSPPPLATS